MIDTHCHLDFDAFDQDRPDVLKECHTAGITDIVIPGTTSSTWERTLELTRTTPGLHAALGLHPYFLEQHTAADIDHLSALLRDQEEVVAVGEIGLDFALKTLEKRKQAELFGKQLTIAATTTLPVILHVRKSHDETIRMLRNSGLQNGGTVHAFNGSMQQAEAYMDMGFCLGFGGMLTYPHSSKLHSLARMIPAENIVLETDAPDMTGFAHHGQRNSPAYLPEVRDMLAKLRGETPEEIDHYTTKNARRVFNLPGN